MTPTHINRSWHADQLACTVTTSPRCRPRGSITATGIDPDRACAVWSVTTHDGRVLPDVTGDYLDAERQLLAATAEQDYAEEQYLRDRRKRVLPQWGGRP